MLIQHPGSLTTGDRLKTSQDRRSLSIANALLQQSSQLRDRGIGFRAIVCPEDEPFLARVYASTREDEMALIDWSDGKKAAFLQMQFEAQHRFYLEHYYEEAEFLIVLEGDRPIGRLYIARWEDEFRIIDIALMPAYRDRGIGTALLKTVLAEGQAKTLPVRIHVEHRNRALNFYHRLGFTQIGEEGVYYLMEWTP